MTAPDHPMPAAGGSYMRNADGSLTEIDPSTGKPIVGALPPDLPELAGVDLAAPDAEVVAALAEPPADPLKPTIKRGAKAPVKEG